MRYLKSVWKYVNNEKIAFFWFKSLGLLFTILSVLSFAVTAHLDLRDKVQEISIKVTEQEQKINSISIRDLREHTVFSFIDNELRTEYSGNYQREWKNQLYDFNDYYNGLINECSEGVENPYNDPYTTNFDNVNINVQKTVDYTKFRHISNNLGVYYILSNGLVNLTYHKHILIMKGKL